MLDPTFRKVIESAVESCLPSLNQYEKEQKLTKEIWKFDHQYDFIYGETVGTLIGIAMGMYIASYKKRPSTDELYEINEIVELRGKEIRDLLSKLKDTNPDILTELKEIL